MRFGEGGQRAEPLGHVAGVLDALVGTAGPGGVAGLHGIEAQHAQRQVGQRALAGRLRVGAVSAFDLVRVEGPGPVVAQLARELPEHHFTHRVHTLWIDAGEVFGEQVLVGQRQHERLERGVELRVPQHGAHGADEGRVEHWLAFALDRTEQAIQGQALARLPAVERVAVVRKEHQKVVVGQRFGQDHWRREAAQQRGHRLGIDVDEGVEVFRLVEHEHALGRVEGRLVFELHRQRAAIAADQRQRHRDHLRLFAFAHLLFEAEGVGARVRVPAPARRDPWRAGLRVPALEEIEPRCQCAAGVGIGDGLREIIAGHGLAVVALEVQVHAAAEALAADQRGHHAHDLGPFFIDGGGVEVVDLDIGVGAHRVRHRAGVFRELQRAQALHVADAADGARARNAGHVHREFLVAEDREALLERELEPVAAGDAVAGPVVEVLVADDGFDAVVVAVGGRGGAGQHVLRVEDVEALVLHRAHVEVADGDDHEALQVERQAEAVLVPDDRSDERSHRVFGLVDVVAVGIDLEPVLLACPRLDLLAAHREIAGDECEQVARFGERVVPLGEVAPVVQRAFFDQVAVGQQHRVLRLVGAQRDAEHRHHVGPVEEVGDAAESLRLALREQARARGVQARELLVLVGRAGVAQLEREAVGLGWVVDDQGAVVTVAERHALAVGHAAQ